MVRRSMLLLSVVALVLVAACGDGGGPAPAVVSVSVDQEDVVLEVGQTVGLSATVTAVGGANTDVVWNSDDESVASVNVTGVVTAVAVGEAVITAASSFDGSRSDSVAVTVLAGDEPAVTEVVIDQGDVVLEVGESAALSVTVTAVAGASTEVMWASDEESVATVSDEGVVTAVGVGEAVVTATSSFDASVSDSITVTVAAGDDDDPGVDVPDGAEVVTSAVEPLPGSDVGDLRVVSRLVESGVSDWSGEARFVVQPDDVSLVAVVDVARGFGWMAVWPAWFEVAGDGVDVLAGDEGVLGPLSTAVSILFANPAFYHGGAEEAAVIVGVLRGLPEVVAFAGALEEHAAEGRPSEHPVVLAAFEAAYDAGVDALGDAVAEAAAAARGGVFSEDSGDEVGSLASSISVHAVDQDAVRFSVDAQRSHIEPVWSAGYQRWAGERTATWLGRLYEVETDEVSRPEVEQRIFDRWNPDFAVRLDAPDRRLRLDAEYSWVAEVVDPIGLSFELLRAAYYWAGDVDERGLEVPEGAYVSHMVTCILGFAGEGRRNDLTFLSGWNEVHDGVSRFDLGLACGQNIIEGGLDALGIFPLDVSGIFKGLVDAGDDDLLLMVTTVVAAATEASAGADVWSSSDYMSLFYRFVVDAMTIAIEHASREGAEAVTDGLLGFLNYLGRVSSAAKTGARIGTMLRVTPLERHAIIVGDPWASGEPGDDEVLVSVAPESVTLSVNGTQLFTATVTGASDTSVTWEASCGSVPGTGNPVTYTAPASAGECVVRATSVADGDAWAEATVTVTAAPVVSVSVEPASVTLPVNGTQSFTATVTGASDTSVSWSATCGSLPGTGNPVTYTAPGTAGECEVTATSVADSTKSATASVTVTASGGDFEPAPSHITIENVTLGAASGGTREVGFDISWDESWRGPDRPTWVEASDNWDAAWVFVKYRVSGGAWQHATLAGGGHVVPVGAVVDVPSDGMGAFVYRSSSGYGTFTANGVGLQWDYVADGVAAGASVEVRPFGIEMVFVPQGSFSLGSGGSSTGEFRAGGTSNTPFVVSSQSSISLGNSSGQLMWSTGASSGSPSGSTNASFPTGYGAFYVMKYQVTQGQYVDFLNTLSQAQADARKHTGSSRRYAITGSSVGSYATSLPFVALNYMSWADGAAFADWAGLRPLTELEFEKAARGPLSPVANEYAWGSTSITQATGLTNAGTITETPTPSGANAAYGDASGVQGPVRVGSFAAPGQSRRDAGAGYYGALELSGNLWERPVTVGNAEGRAFTGAHGDGALDGSGNANVASWPGANAVGAGFRGGSWRNDVFSVRVSYRTYAASTGADRYDSGGWRGARSAP